ncbi:hypothetical protein HOO54_04370 [Bacillus sp. WMMC1349]|uniref:hypothetical protein n=1 Tax=Bacillus sp. WMMC1349 TaxID=2736254 RepID=UPI0015578E36|nr:hypothetical protein [Bacillus sp. WMMC1349]NPC91497.1 hypothetical protein [Bacillus sp. WMMC1349]
MKRRNKMILYIYLFYAIGIMFTSLLIPSDDWVERTGVIITHLLLLALAVFFIGKATDLKDETKSNSFAKQFWRKYRKPIMISFYVYGLIVVFMVVFSLPSFSLLWKIIMSILLFFGVSIGCFVGDKVTSKMLLK